MTVFKLPDLGEGLAEAEIREWYVKVGDTVKVDQPLVSMETAKAVVDVPSPFTGKIAQLHGEVNDIIKTGAPLITFTTETSAKDQGSVVGKLETHDKKWDEHDVIIGSPRTRTAHAKTMPGARAQTKQLGSGTETVHGVRRVMAQVMAQAHREVVPVTIFEDADITNLSAEQDLSVLLLQALVAACKAEPALNAWFDGRTLERKLFTEVNAGLAVDSVEGLLVPVIKQVESKSATELRKQIDAYKAAAKQRSLAPADMQGATITLSNFGTFAGRYATPIILPPTVAILGCGRSREVPLVHQGKVVVGRILPLSLSFDHRAVTGGEATRFLGTIISYLNK